MKILHPELTERLDTYAAKASNKAKQHAPAVKQRTAKSLTRAASWLDKAADRLK